MKRLISILAAVTLFWGLCLPALAQDETPVLTVSSHLSGSAFTTGKSTLKRDRGIDVAFDGEALLTLSLPTGEAIDDALIDASGASVALVDGIDYNAGEYIFKDTALTGDWKDGALVYTLSEDAITLNRGLYPQSDNNSGREWSCLAGDGAGNYRFWLEVSGIEYDGKTVPAAQIPVAVHIYGFNYTGDADSLYAQSEAPVAALAEWTDAPDVTEDSVVYAGEDEIPILCDGKSDNFYILWAGTQNENLTAEDFSITLSSAQGDTKTLVPEQDYVVANFDGQTQIALTYQNWAFLPVYDTLQFDGAGISASLPVATVWVYEHQQGGGGTTVDGTVTAYTFSGLKNLTRVDQLMSKAIYMLTIERDGKTLYYAQDGTLTERMEEAALLDASGEDKRNQQLVGNTLYITTRQSDVTETVTVDGEALEMHVTYPGRGDAVSGGGSLLSPSQCDPELEPLPGYAIPWGTENFITNEKWAWQKGIEQGWTGIEVSPWEGKYEWSVQQGTSEQFTADDDVTWSLVGGHTQGTSIDENGLLTVSADEPTSAFFAVVATNAEGEKGSVSIKVTAAP